MSLYLIPVILVGTLIYAIVKKVAVYDCFIDGAKESLVLVKSIFPYLAVIFIAIELFRASGLSALLSKGLSYPFRYLGIPPEISELVLLVPTARNLRARAAGPHVGQRCARPARGHNEHLRTRLVHRALCLDDSGRFGNDFLHFGSLFHKMQS